MRRTQKPILPVHARSLSLTDESVAQLEALASDLSDLTGRRVSISGAVRALAAYADRQGYTWAQRDLLPLHGRQQKKTVWGRFSKQRKTVKF